MDSALSDELYTLFRDLLYKRAGLYYPEHRRTDLAHGLTQALATSLHTNLSDLYKDVRDNAQPWDVLVSHLTVGETRFFRNEAHFDALRQHILPNLIQRRATTRTLRIWSAGCASGEEPYSIAMLLTDLLTDLENWNVSILGTDINAHFLNRAREGLYSAWSFRETPDSLRERFFSPEQGRWRLHGNIRRMVNFMRLNLVEDTYPSLTNGTSALDIIICRNVTIYFDAIITRQIVERFYGALVPGGWLLVGHSEPHAGTYYQFETQNFPNAIFYRKSLDAPLFACASQPVQPDSQVTAPVKSPRKPVQSRPEKAVSGKTESTAPGQHKPRQKPDRSPAHSTPAPAAPALGPQTPPLKPDLWGSIKEYLQKGDKVRAELLLRQLVDREPAHVEALVTLGRLHADRGEWDSAEICCTRALETHPLSIAASFLLAQVYEHQQNLDAALSAYRRTTYIDRNFVPGVLGMANIWRQMGRMTEARRMYRNLLRYLTSLPTTSVVPDADGATAYELVTFVNRQLEALS